MNQTVRNVLGLFEMGEDDEEALTALKIVKDFEYEAPPRFDPKNITREELATQINEMVFFAKVVNRMKHLKAETVARVAITHMMHTFTSLFEETITTEGVKHGPDLVVNMKELAEDAINCMDHMQFIEAMEEYHLSKPTASDTNKSQESESDYQPSPAEQSEEETDAKSKEVDCPMRKRRAQTPTLASPPKIPAANPSSPVHQDRTKQLRSAPCLSACSKATTFVAT